MYSRGGAKLKTCRMKLYSLLHVHGYWEKSADYPKVSEGIALINTS